MQENIFETIKLGNYVEENLDPPLSAFEAFKRLYPYFQTLFLLESLGEEGRYNRYSYVGFDPSATIAAKGKDLFLNGKILTKQNPYMYISQLPQKDDVSAGFVGGLTGYFSYEATGYFEEAFTGHKNYDFFDFELGYYLDGLRFDKKKKKCTYFHHGLSRLNAVVHYLNKPEKLASFNYKHVGKRLSPAKHKKTVEEALKKIRQGDIFQVVLSTKSHFHIEGDTRRLYAHLRQINPSAYMMYFKFGNREILSASPELLIGVKARKIEHFGTLAGTIKRGRDQKQDEILAKTLRNDSKEMAEHMMLVDLARNDIGKICEFGSITVGELASIKRASHVQHLSTEIYGQLKNGMTAFHALAASFPAGTLSGAPKIEAMKIIAQLEGENRGPYGGVGGYFSLNGEAMMAILIRSLFTHGDMAYTQTGSGIVLDSISKNEYQEIIHKQQAIEEALEKASSQKKGKI